MLLYPLLSTVDSQFPLSEGVLISLYTSILNVQRIGDSEENMEGQAKCWLHVHIKPLNPGGTSMGARRGD